MSETSYDATFAAAELLLLAEANGATAGGGVGAISVA